MPKSSKTLESRTLADALRHVEDGNAPSRDDAALLLAASGDELERLLDVASRVRDAGLEAAGLAGVITYSKKVFLPITTLCRDRCHYCIFVDTPGKLLKKNKPPYMSGEEILTVARQGAALGCKEALFTLGDRPEDRWPIAREWLDEHGYATTLDYIRDMGQLVLEETGMLPHFNPGVMSWTEMQRLRPHAPSMGMMLETTSRKIWEEKGGAHYGSPDKDPLVRLQVLEDAGRSRVPFSTGVLLGIGETLDDRADALFAIRESHERYGHIQETIVQNFRTKPGTAMQNDLDLGTREYIAAVAVARLVMGPEAHIQAPPNLTDSVELHLLIRAGIDDWGGVSPLTPDHVNPERPWPQLEDLANLTARSGYELRERLTAHREYVQAGQEWIDERIVGHVAALAASDGLAQADAPVIGRPWVATGAPAGRHAAPAVFTGELGAALRRAEDAPASLSDEEYVELLAADGDALEALTDLADRVRRDTVGDELTYVVNRNIDSALVTAAESARDGALSLAEVDRLVGEAWELGATEICAQGAPSAAEPGRLYLDLVKAVKTARPEMHLHAFRPAELVDGAARLDISVRELLEALRDLGLGSVPGTGARILDDTVRATLSGGTDMPVAAWVDVVTTAHRAGLRSTSTMVYGHVETPAQVVAHLRTLAEIQDETGGFSEFIAMPHVPMDAPAHLLSVARPGPTLRETRAVHAVARLLLHGRIDHVQAAWPKLGLGGAHRLLTGGADDMGGLLVDGGTRPGAGAESGRTLDTRDLEQMAEGLGRTLRQRTTDYGDAVAIHGPRPRVTNHLDVALDVASRQPVDLPLLSMARDPR